MNYQVIKRRSGLGILYAVLSRKPHAAWAGYEDLVVIRVRPDKASGYQSFGWERGMTIPAGIVPYGFVEVGRWQQ